MRGHFKVHLRPVHWFSLLISQIIVTDGSDDGSAWQAKPMFMQPVTTILANGQLNGWFTDSIANEIIR